MPFLTTKIVKEPYKLFERYAKELSDDPYGEQNRNGKCKTFCSNYVCAIVPYFQKDIKEDYVPQWAMSDDAVQSVVRFMNPNKTLGFAGISPAILHDTWEMYMVPNLYRLWSKFIYGNDENIVPDFKNFCLLVKTQVHGKIEDKAKVVQEILLEKGYSIPRKNISFDVSPSLIIDDENPDEKRTVEKYKVTRYFYDLTVSYLYGLRHIKNIQYLMWESCIAGLSERHLRKCMKYYTQRLSQNCADEDIKLLLKKKSFLKTILFSSVSMMFGMQFSLSIVPFLVAPRETMLDVSQAIFLTSVLKGDEDVSYEMKMFYSKVLDRVTRSKLYETIVHNQSPTFILVKDEKGHVFGGYASVPWKLTQEFIGDDKCFLFRLLPDVVVCKASNIDQNFMFLHPPQKTSKVHGLGMGGSLMNFGFWIDLMYGFGSCAQSCPTFQNYETLSYSRNFKCVQLEMWRVKRREQQRDRAVMLPRVGKTDVLKLLEGNQANIIDKTEVEIEFN